MNVDFLVSTKNNCKMVKNVTKFKSMCNSKTCIEGECKRKSGNLYFLKENS